MNSLSNATSSHRFLPLASSLTAATLVTVVTLLAGCANPGSTTADTTSGAVKTDMDEGKVHAASAADTAFLASDEPIASNTVVLFANGLGCPQCASNIDLLIKKRVPGAQDIYVDLSDGTATVDILPGTKRRLSPKQYHDIVGDAGFTLVKITSR